MDEKPNTAAPVENPYASPASAPPPRRRFLRYIAYTVAAVAIAIVVGFAVELINVALVSLEAENHLIAMSLTLETVDQYVQDFGDWPRSWGDLERARPRSGNSISAQELERIRNWVEVDFTLNLDSVNTADPNAFQAIRPKPPCFEDYDWRIRGLLQTIAARHTKPKPG